MCFEMYHIKLFIVEKMGFGTAPRRCGIRSKSHPLLLKTCISYTFETLALYARMCLRTQATTHYASRGLLWSFNFQKYIFAHLKGYIFHFNSSQVILISDWALNWSWALEFEHH